MTSHEIPGWCSNSPKKIIGFCFWPLIPKIFNLKKQGEVICEVKPSWANSWGCLCKGSSLSSKIFCSSAASCVVGRAGPFSCLEDQNSANTWRYLGSTPPSQQSPGIPINLHLPLGGQIQRYLNSWPLWNMRLQSSTFRTGKLPYPRCSMCGT